jgi:hypothetical protein
MQLNSKKIIFAAGMIILLGTIFIPSVFAQSGPNAQMVDLKFPCPTGMSGCAQLTDAASSSNPVGTFLNAFYQIALTVSGLLALLMIIAGGVSYAISAGSVDKQSEAKDMITSALYGLALLLGSYLILHTINPKITALTLPGSEPQYGPVATSGPKIAVPNTECIPLNSTTWDPNNTSTLATSTDYGSLVHPYTYLGNNQYDFNSADASSTANCKNRVFINGSKLTISNDDYYDVGLGNLWNRLIGKGGTVVIDKGSTIWQYPYFPSNSTNPSADARCLIYAYQDPNPSSSPNMVGLNTNLTLCYPHPQQISQQGSVSSADTGNCRTNFPCKCSMSRCSDINNKLPYKGPGLACTGSTCFLDDDLIALLENVHAKITGWQVSEAWPPTVPHISRCHNIGTCADLVLQPQASSVDSNVCANVENLVQALRKAGADIVANEYPTQCGGHAYETTTGWNIHVELDKVFTDNNY